MAPKQTMTKSLHTVTAVARVAAFIRTMPGSPDGSTAQLTSKALAVLGYSYTPSQLAATTDDTLQRCLAAVAAL